MVDIDFQDALKALQSANSMGVIGLWVVELVECTQSWDEVGSARILVSEIEGVMEVKGEYMVLLKSGRKLQVARESYESAKSVLRG